MNPFCKQFEKLYQYALEENDVIIHAMLESFLHTPEHWSSWEDFLVDVALALSAVNKASRDHLSEVLSKQPPTPYIVPIDHFIPDGAWSTDYK